MKKILGLLSTSLCASALFANPVLNPAEPALLTQGTFLCDEGDCWGLKFGYRGDFSFDKQFQFGAGDNLWTNEGVLTLNLWDRLDIFGFVGSAAYDVDDAVGGFYIIGHSRTRTIWGVGAKAVLLETCWGNCGTTYLGIEGSYESMARNAFDRFSINGAFVDPAGVGYRYHSGQVSLGLAHRIANFVPYVAVKWSNAIASVPSDTFIDDLPLQSANNVRHWGYAFGVTLVDVGRMDITAEARFIDETACTVAANIRF